MTPAPLTEAELMAHADGRLAEDRRAALDAHLQANPHATLAIAAWREQNRALHALYDPVLDEPLPARLLDLANSPAAGPGGATDGRTPGLLPTRTWFGSARSLAAGIAIAALGACLGWIAHGLRDAVPVTAQSLDAGAGALAHRAAVAYAVYAPEVRHPVEVSADQSQHLISWLSKRLAMPLRVPQLGASGFALVGGRLLPGGRGPGAQLMYEDAGGRRLTLYVSNDGDPDAATGFRFAREGAVLTFYWIDGARGYALSGAIARPALEAIARTVYEQISAM